MNNNLHFICKLNMSFEKNRKGINYFLLLFIMFAPQISPSKIGTKV